MNNDIKNLREILLYDDGISNFVISLIKNMMEKLLQQELTEFLKYDKYSDKGKTFKVAVYSGQKGVYAGQPLHIAIDP